MQYICEIDIKKHELDLMYIRFGDRQCRTNDRSVKTP